SGLLRAHHSTLTNGLRGDRRGVVGAVVVTCANRHPGRRRTLLEPSPAVEGKCGCRSLLERRQANGLLGLVLVGLWEPAGGELGPPALGRLGVVRYGDHG